MFGKTNIRLMKKGGYVTDGLILHLDGIDYGGDPTKWIDLVNGDEFAVNGDVTKNANSYRFDGGYIAINKTYNINHIEIVLKYDSVFKAGMVINASQSNKNIVVLNFGYMQIPASSIANSRISTSANTLFSLSTDYSNKYVNAALKTGASPYDNYLSTFSGLKIGAYGTGTGTALKGEICSIKIYNRTLTADEIAQNFAIDKVRFNIPD